MVEKTKRKKKRKIGRVGFNGLQEENEKQRCGGVEVVAAAVMGDLFQRRIEFHPARKPSSIGYNNNNNTNFHLETLNPQPHNSTSSNPCSPNLSFSAGNKLKSSPPDPELSFQLTVRRIGAGLENLGNTCFLNSVLQCLTYTEPFAAYLQNGNHKSSCHTSGFCALCSIQNHVKRALQSSGRILAPKDLVMNLRCISRNFRNARQEDAHEYMIHLLESIHKCCLPSGVPTQSPSAYDKSLVHKIFGGRLRSQVKCMECLHCSNTFDPFLDLSLEIVKADTLLKALAHFTAVEQLDGGGRQYQCQRCNHKVKALKQLTISKPPYVLSIHLKRFSSHVPGQKINKNVEFRPTLDLKPYVTGFNEGDLKYTLYGVLVHAGWSTHSGHYYCFVRTSSGLWHSLDDNRVIQVSERTVLQQKAYMLFYVRDREKHMEYSKPVLHSKPIERQCPRVKVENELPLKLKPTDSSPPSYGLPLKLKTTDSCPPSSAIIDKNKGTNATAIKLPETIKIEKPKKKVLWNPNMGIGPRLLRRASLVNKRKRKKTEPPASASERKRTKNTDIRESNAVAPSPLEEKSSSKSLEFTVSHWEDGSKDRETMSIGFVPTDEWDEEYDRGKRKKIRNPINKFGDSKNPFQEAATKLRKDKFKTF